MSRALEGCRAQLLLLRFADLIELSRNPDSELRLFGIGGFQLQDATIHTDLAGQTGKMYPIELARFDLFYGIGNPFVERELGLFEFQILGSIAFDRYCGHYLSVCRSPEIDVLRCHVDGDFHKYLNANGLIPLARLISIYSSPF